MTGSEIKITFLGTGSAIPPNGMQQVSTALRHKNGLILFDCGEGSQYALRKYGISTRKEFCIWISHLHSDHFLGLPGLLSSLELLGRDDPVKIIGPEGIKQTVHNILIANYVNPSYEILVYELQPGEVYTGSGYTLETIKAIHEANALSVIFQEDSVPGKVNMDKLRSLGVKPGPDISELQTGNTIEINGHEIKPQDVIGPERRGRVVFYSGDTSYNELLVETIEVCDLMIHEATYPSDMTELAQERNHTTIRQAAQLARKIKPEKMVITHLSPRITDWEEELSKAKDIFPEFIVAKEGESLDIEYLYHEEN